jgi:predicted ribosomally synthesized peptide with nif11-like leader
MSKEAAEQMLRTAMSDKELQQRLEAANGFADVVQIGASIGYQFTTEELQTVMAERGIPIGDEGELSEEALEAVAGGSWIDDVGRWTDNVDLRFRGW